MTNFEKIFIGLLITFFIGSTFAIAQMNLIVEQLEATKNIDGSYDQIKYNGNYEVHNYEAPNKEYGYQIIEYAIDGTIYSTGYGIEEKERTYTIYPEIIVASTTIDI